MRKLNLLLAFSVIGCMATLAQSIETPLANYNLMKNRIEKDEEKISDPSKNTNPKVWYNRALSLMDYFQMHRKFLVPRQSTKINIMINYPNPEKVETWTKDGAEYEKLIYDKLIITLKNGVLESYEETEKIVEEPLLLALESLKKTEELDEDGKMDKRLERTYEDIYPFFNRATREAYIKGDTTELYKYATATVEIAKNKYVKDAVKLDTLAVFLAGSSANGLGKYQEAVKYLEMCKENDFFIKNPDELSLYQEVYLTLFKTYKELGKTEKAEEALLAGFKKKPDSPNIQVELINYYLENQKMDEALKVIKEAQKSYPDNASFFFVEGSIYDKQLEFDNALEAYSKALEIKPDYYEAHYNIGAIHYNNAKAILDSINAVKDIPDDEYEAGKEKAFDKMRESIPNLEKAYELNPNDAMVKNTLKTVYSFLGMTEEYEKLKN